MKEVRFFYDPFVAGELPEDEALHAIRVLRLKEGDEIYLMDGKGSFYQATITHAHKNRCAYHILAKEPQDPAWDGWIHLAMAPTKMMERTEWLVEKATEVGMNELTFLKTHNSERKVVKDERIEKILVAAMKQSHKAYKPQYNSLTDFTQFIDAHPSGNRYICHCYSQEDIPTPQPYLLDVLKRGEPSTVLIGPEGDFSIEEVRYAIAAGFQPVSLGKSRLRTETAALVAVHCMQIKNQCS